MNITYIGPAYDGTGFSIAANRTILGLDKTHHKVNVRSVKLTGQVIPALKRVQELEQVKFDKTDFVIQHYLPPLMVYHAGAKNVGYFHAETTHFAPSNWQYNLNLMDEIWVCSKENKESAERSGVRKPVKVVPIPYYDEYDSIKESLDVGFSKDTYVFYNIGDFSNRKNIMGLIKAYYLAFTRYDNVTLVLKTYCDGQPSHKSAEIIKGEINNLRRQLKLYSVDLYPPVYLLCDYMPNEDIKRLHNLGDCFISLERGAAWNIPCYEATGLGKEVIITGKGGQMEFLESAKPFGGIQLVEVTKERVEGMASCPYPGLYTAYEQWYDPSIDETVLRMKNAFAQGKKKYNRDGWIKQWDLDACVSKFNEVLA